jgi:hypothetical protein
VSSAEEAVRMLSGLAADDRQWILERLPVEAKARLAEHVDDHAPRRPFPFRLPVPPASSGVARSNVCGQ